MVTPTYLQPFVLPTEPCARERQGPVEFYLPPGQSRHPAVVLVHGGPIPKAMVPKPPDWPVYVGYGQALAARGTVGVTVSHRLRSHNDYGPSAADLADALDAVRVHPRVAADRVALWFFSGGGPLGAAWLDVEPARIRCLAFTYPLLADRPDHLLDARFQPVSALGDWRGVPIVLTRAGLEKPDFATTVSEFLAAADAKDVPVRVIDVPNRRHGFDFLDDTDESRAAITEALDVVLGQLQA